MDRIRGTVERAKASPPTRWTKALVLQWCWGSAVVLIIAAIVSAISNDWLFLAFAAVFLVLLIVVLTLFMLRPDYRSWFLTVRGFLIVVGVGTLILLVIFVVAALLLPAE